jgi:hypothetical protein
VTRRLRLVALVLSMAAAFSTLQAEVAPYGAQAASNRPVSGPPSGGGATSWTIIPPGSTGDTTGTTGTTGRNCDPNTGICGSPGVSGGTTGTSGTGSLTDSGQQVRDTPVTLSGKNGNGVAVRLMALAAGLLFLLGLAPPLIAQAARRRRQRRGIDEFYGDASRPGKGRRPRPYSHSGGKGTAA